MKQFSTVIAILLVVFAFVLYWLNRTAVDLAMMEVFDTFLVALKILFIVGVPLAVAWAAIEIKHHHELKVIRSGNLPAQAVKYKGEIVHLQQPGQMQMDPMQQMQMLKMVMQLQGQMGKFAQQQMVIEEVKPKEIEGPKERIPAIVRYEDVRDEVPEDMSLLGIHPSDGALELSDWEKLKMLWIIGSSSTGKSNTIFGKALEACNHHAKLMIIDQHAVKPDSLSRKLDPLKSSFLRPIAVTDSEVLSTIQAFKAEFEARVNGASCERKIVLIMDEVNRMVRNDALIVAIKEIVAIGGEEARGFGLYLWVISQKAVHLKWLRDSAITVIVHRLTRFEEALLACNEDRKAAKRLLEFPVGRSFIYGVDFDSLIELQQPLYEVPEESVIESTVQSREDIDTEEVESISSSDGLYATPAVEPMDRTLPFSMEKFKQARKLILERETQNKIICEVWQVQENTRPFRAAKEEFQLMLAYLASMAREA